MRLSNIRSLFALITPLVVVASMMTGTTRPAVASVPSCSAKALTLRVETGDGRFTGMSHDGGIVVVRNTGESACSVPGMPALAMRDASGAVVATGEAPSARFMHPGPVVLPIELEAGEVAAAQIRWIVGNVYGTGAARSVASTTLSLTIENRFASAPLAATVWGKADMPVTFQMERLTKALPELGTPTASEAGTYVGEGPAGSTYLYGTTPARKLVLRGSRSGAFAFTFDGIGGFEQSPKIGSIAGTLDVNGTRATFHRPPANRSLDVTFYGPQLTIAQTGDCGFGNGVSAAGQYREQ